MVRGGRIVGLYLQEGGITELPEAIGNLTTQPVEIARLQELRILSIADNQLQNLPPAVVQWAGRFDPKGLLAVTLMSARRKHQPATRSFSISTSFFSHPVPHAERFFLAGEFPSLPWRNRDHLARTSIFPF